MKETEIHNINDRMILCLLKHKAKDYELTNSENIEFQRLSAIYVDSKQFEQSIIKLLNGGGLLDQSEFKQVPFMDTSLKQCVGYKINDNGIKAISSGLFVSESKQRDNKDVISKLTEDNLRLSIESQEYQKTIRKQESIIRTANVTKAVLFFIGLAELIIILILGFGKH